MNLTEVYKELELLPTYAIWTIEWIDFFERCTGSKKNKLRSDTTHSIQRAKERYNLDLDLRDIALLSQWCEYKHNILFTKYIPPKEQYVYGNMEYYLKFKGETIRVFYNPVRKVVSSFLPIFY